MYIINSDVGRPENHVLIFNSQRKYVIKSMSKL